MASISISQSTSSKNLLKKEPSTENLKQTSKSGFLNRSKSNSNINIGGELKVKYSEGSSITTGVASSSTLQVPTIVVQSSSSSSSSSTHSPHHQKTSSNSSNFNIIKNSFNQISNSLSNSGLISPRSKEKEKEKENNNNNMSVNNSPLINNNLKGKNVASIIAANGVNINNSLSNLHLHANNVSSGNLSSSFNSVSQNNISISSSGGGGAPLSYNYTQQLNSSNSVNSSSNSIGNNNSNQLNQSTSVMMMNESSTGSLSMSMDNGSNGNIGDVAYYSNSMNGGGVESKTETIEIMVVGDELSNKARFISSFLNNGIGEDPTLEISTKKSISIQSGAYNVNINTTVGQEEFWGINDVYYRSSQGFIFVYNVNSRESFLSFLKFRDKIIHEKGTENILMTMVGLTSPLVNESGEESSIREVTFNEAKRMADLYSCSFVELESFGLDCEHQIQSIVTDLLGRITNYQSSISSSSNNVNGVNNNNNTNNAAESTAHQTIEILMLGDIFVGKTQIIQRLLGNSFQSSYRETTEWSKNIAHQMTVNDTRYLLKIIDTCGLNIEDTLSRERLVNTQGFVFVYSNASRDSFMMIESLRKKLQNIRGDASKIPSVLIANKSDTLIRQVTFDEGSKMAQHLGSQSFFDISTITSDDDSIIKPFEQLIMDIQKSGNTSLDMAEIKKKGYLFKEGKKLKSMSKYYFKVNKCALSYCKNEFNKSKMKTIVLSEQVQLAIPHNEKKDVWPFQIITDPISKQTINLIAATEEERNSWIKAIKFNCYLEEITCNIIDDVVKGFVSEIAHQQSSGINSGSNNLNSSTNSSGSSTPSSTNFKRSDTNQQFNNNNNGGVMNSPGGSGSVYQQGHYKQFSGGSSSGSSSPLSSPYGSNVSYSHLSQSTSSMSMSPQQQLQSVLLSSNLSSSMGSSFNSSSSLSDSLSGSPPEHHQGGINGYPQSPQLKKSLFQRTTSFSKGSKPK